MNKGGFSWKRATGVTRTKQRISRTTGVPLTKSGRQRKVGKMATGGGCLLPVTLVALIFLAACGGAAATPTPAPAAYDLAAVKANFRDECLDPIVLTEDVCTVIDIDGMTADGTILTVPTSLPAGPRDEAKDVCNQMAAAHFDLDGEPLGYEVIGVLFADGSNAAACTIDTPA